MIGWEFYKKKSLAAVYGRIRASILSNGKLNFDGGWNRVDEFQFCRSVHDGLRNKTITRRINTFRICCQTIFSYTQN